MTYDALLQTDDLSETVPSKLNENHRQRAFLNDAAKSADFTVWADDTTGAPRDIYLVTTGASTITVTLPDVTDTTGDAYKGRVVTIFKADSGAGNVTVDPNGSQTINGSTSVTLTAIYDYITIFSDGVEWFIVRTN